MEIRNALSKLTLSSFKLAVVTGKPFKTKEEERIRKFCDLNEIEDETPSFVNAEIIRTSGKV